MIVDDIVVVRGGDSFGLEDSTDFSGCACQGSVLEVLLNTGWYPDGLSWQITRGNESVLEGGGFDDSYSEYFISTCMEACDSKSGDPGHVFTIFSSDGDGMNGGSYTVSIDGEVKLESTDSYFGYEESRRFTDNCPCLGVALSVEISTGSNGRGITWNLTKGHQMI